MRAFAAAHPLLLVLAIGGVVTAAVTLAYSTTSTVTTGVRSAPVQFLAGGDAGPSALGDYVTSYSISTNKTYVSIAVKGVPEATLTVGSLFKLQNVDDSSRTVTLTTTQVTNAYVSVYTMEIYDASEALVATLDLRAASPSASFSLPASTTYHAKMTLRVGSGATPALLGLSNPLTLAVSA